MGCGSCGKSFGIMGLAKGLLYGPADEATQRQRMEICRGCAETDNDDVRLFREIDGAHYCGRPHKLIELRDEFINGCGCELEFKTSRQEASCPRGLWEAEKAAAAAAEAAAPEAVAGDVMILSLHEMPGDVVAAAHAVAGYKAKHPDRKVTWVVHGRHLDWARLFPVADELAVIEQQPVQEFKERFSTIAVTPGVQKHVTFAAALGASPARPRLELSSDDLKWADTLHSADKPIVVIAPLQQHTSHTWPLRRWLELEEALMQAGMAVVVVDPDKHGNLTSRFRSLRHFAVTPAQTAALIRRASLVIGGDTNVIHLAGCLSRPALILAGPIAPGDEFGFYPTVEAVHGVVPCQGCRYEPQAGFTRYCEMGCEALFEIPLSRVLARINAMVPMEAFGLA